MDSRYCAELVAYFDTPIAKRTRDQRRAAWAAQWRKNAEQWRQFARYYPTNVTAPVMIAECEANAAKALTE